jgi:hypothetical protein
VVDVSKKRKFLTLLSTFFKLVVLLRSTMEKKQNKKLLCKNIVCSGKFSYRNFSAMLLKMLKFLVLGKANITD